MDPFIHSLLVGLILIGIVSLIGWGIFSLIPVPPQVKIVIWVVVGVICLVILLHAISGSSHGIL